jgi:transglutaminase-like putative cysteine protease
MFLLLFALAAGSGGDVAPAARDTALSAVDPLIASSATIRALESAADDDDGGRATTTMLATKAKSPLARAIATWQGARRPDLVDDGAFDRLGIPHAVRCIGPFANTGGTAFGLPLDVDDVAGTLKTAVSGLSRPVRWQDVPRDPSGTFEVEDHFVAQREVRARCVVVVEMAQPTTVAVRAGASGPLLVRHGARDVIRSDEAHAFGFDQHAGLVQLPRGKSLLVVELGLLEDGGSFVLRLTRPDATPLPALRTSTTPQDIAAAAKAPVPELPQAAVKSLVAVATGDDVLTTPEHLFAATTLLRAIHAFDERAKPSRLEVLLERRRAQAKSPLEEVAAVVDLARLVGDGDPTRAQQLLDRAIGLAPENARVLVAMARLREQQDDSVGAALLWRRVEHEHAVGFTVARLQFQRHGPLAVRADTEVLRLAQSSSHPTLLRLAADVLQDRGDRRGALEFARRSGHRQLVALLESQLAEARLAVDADAFARLTAAVQTRLQAAPASHHLALQYALLLLEAHDDVGLDALLAARLQHWPERPEPHRLAAQIALLRKHPEVAAAALQEALALTPDDGDLQRSLRSLQQRSGGDDDIATRLLPAFDDDALRNARAAPPADAAAAGAFVERKVIGTRFFENGQLQRVEDLVIVVLDAKKAAGLQAYGFGYSSGREQLEVLAAERVGADGRREAAQRVVDRGQDGKENGAYSDARSKTVVFSGLVDGDVLHIRVRKEATGLQNLFGDFFGDLEVLQTPLPLRHFRMTIEAPPSRPLFVGGRGAPQPVVRDGNGVKTWDFVVDNVPALQGEPGMPPWLEVAQSISVSTYADWPSMGVWYEALIGDQLRLDDELRAVARRLKAEASDERDLVRRVYEHVVTSTRYVGIELGIHGWKPYPVSEVYRRRYGDCKDKASLLVALLREVGVEAHLALVRTIQLGHVGEAPASMWAFNHAIAWVASMNLFLDGTAEHSGWHELPAMDQGAYAMIVDGRNSRLVTIPVDGADANLNTSNYVLRVQPDGSLVTDGEERFRGEHNAEQRARLADVANRRANLERDLAQGIPGVQVTSVEATDLSLSTTELGYRFSAVFPKRAVVEAEGSLVMPLSLYPHDVAGNYASQSSRRFELFVERPWRTRNVMRYVLPPGLRVENLPSGGTVSGEHLQFTQKVTATADGFIVDEDTAITSRRIPVADYAAFREQALSADRLMKRKIRIVRATEQVKP